MNVIKITYPPFDNVASYLVYWADDDAILIDCVPKCYDKVMRYCKELGKEIKVIFLTHGHIDHIHDINKFEATDAKFAIHDLDEEKLYTKKHLGDRFGMSILPVSGDIILNKKSYYIKSHEIKVIHTPGHTAGSVCFDIEGVLFTGDTLFRGSVGRTDFEDGNFDQLMESLAYLKKKYPPHTLVYPGHGLETTLENESIFNYYFKQA